MPIRAFYLNVDPRFPTANKSDNTDKNRHPPRRRRQNRTVKTNVDVRKGLDWNSGQVYS
ncbi:hypothetical protein AAF712_005694 [Marasmius tenuissimus]|uniref:Uncharacterized protein n=1 Tax=Marasmius tenuissimus TaxID=585030 RepID=A0ABR2ZZW7_9AGAR